MNSIGNKFTISPIAYLKSVCDYFTRIRVQRSKAEGRILSPAI